MKATRQPKHSNCGTAGIATACLILLSPLTGHAINNDEQLWTASGSGDLQALTALVTANAELVAAHDRFGKLPLHYAAEAGQIETVKFLIANGADIMAQDNRGWTALHHAVDNKQAKMMDLLIAHGAKVDAPNSMQWTPLHLAVLRQNKAMVIALIKAGADVYAKTGRDLTPYNLAVDSGKRDLVDHLVAAMVNKGRQPQLPELALPVMALAETTRGTSR
jgi:ankyrin repeat protein